MVPGFLVLCLVAGILHADGGGGGFARAAVGWLPVGLGGLLALSGFLLLRERGRVNGRVPSAVGTMRWLRGLVFCVAGLVCFTAGYDSLERRFEQAKTDGVRALRAADEGIRRVEGRVEERRTGSWGDEITLGGVEAVDGGAALPRRIRLRVSASGPAGASIRGDRKTGGRPGPTRSDELMWPGARVRLGLRLSPLRGQRNPGTPDFERAAARRGLAARGRLADPEWVVLEVAGIGGLDRTAARTREARRGLKRTIAEKWSGLHRGSGLARALAIGDRSGLGRETREAFRALGLAHLVAVSGLHVGLVAGLTGWLALLCVRGRMPSGVMPFAAATLVGCAAASLYAWLTGAGLSVQRAAGLLLLVVGFRFARRDLRPFEALSMIAGMMLARDPASLFDLGAQLSFASCSALWLGVVWVEEEGRESDGAALSLSEASQKSRSAPRATAVLRGAVFDWLLSLLRASLVVSLGTGWILAAHGLSSPWLGPVFNLVAIPWTAMLALPGAIAALAWTAFGPLEVWGLELLRVLLWPASLLGEGAVAVAALLPARSAPGWLHWLPMALLAAVGLGAARFGHWWWVLLVWSFLAWAGNAPPCGGGALGHAPRVVFFDVGQGDASLVEGTDHSLLIDTGPGPPDGSGGGRLVRALHALGLRSLDTLVVTHADLDHRGGARRVLDSMSVGEIWLPDSDRSSPVLGSLAAHAVRRGVRVRWRGAEGQVEVHGGGEIETRILWPPVAAEGLSRNEGSLVLAVELRGARFLFTADVGRRTEEALLRSTKELRAEFLKVSHHGSRRSSSPAILSAVGARLAVLSAPCIATRGLPSPVVLERLRATGTAIAWTGRDGAVAIELGEGRNSFALRRWARSRRCEL